MSNLIKIGLLLLAAVLVALIARLMFSNNAHSSVPAPMALERVRIAAADLPQGMLLRDDDITSKQMPKDAVPTNAVVGGGPGALALKGALLKHAVVSGGFITLEDVILPGAPGFLAAILKPEMRAVSVAVDDVSGNAGLIQPGDYVDLLLTQQMDRRTDAPDLAVASETVVERVRVLAVGSQIQRPKTGDAAEAANPVRTVTLEVTPHVGEVIAVAARLGSLSLALRSFATSSRNPALPLQNAVPEHAPVWAGDVSPAVRSLSRAHGPQPSGPLATRPVVMIYRGSTQGDSALAASPPDLGGVRGTPAPPPIPTVAPLR